MTGVHTVWKSDVWGTWHAIWTYENESNNKKHHGSQWLPPTNILQNISFCVQELKHIYTGLETTGCMTDLTEPKQWQHHNILKPWKWMINISTTVFTWNSMLSQNITWNYYCTAQHYHVSCPGNHIMMVSHSKLMVMMCSRYWPMTAVLLLLWRLLEDRDSMFVPLRDTGVSRELSVL